MKNKMTTVLVMNPNIMIVTTKGNRTDRDGRIPSKDIRDLIDPQTAQPSNYSPLVVILLVLYFYIKKAK